MSLDLRAPLTNIQGGCHNTEYLGAIYRHAGCVCIICLCFEVSMPPLISVIIVYRANVQLKK